MFKLVAKQVLMVMTFALFAGRGSYNQEGGCTLEGEGRIT